MAVTPLPASSEAPLARPNTKPQGPSLWRAWFALVRFSFERQARARQMIWIALALWFFTTALIAINTAANRWGMWHWRWRWFVVPIASLPANSPPPRSVIQTYDQAMQGLHALPAAGLSAQPTLAVHDAIVGSFAAALSRSDFHVFSSWVVFSIFLSFLLPLWSLSFATEAIGSERESRSLIWLLTRPLPRSSIYLAKFCAVVPWTLALNLGGFAVMCLVAGWPGRLALDLYWPAILWASLAFAALFHFLSACFRRAAVVALIYSFFLETILGNMPGTLKRVSIGFYARCMMFDAAHEYGVQPVKPSVYLPVSGGVACAVLIGITLVLLMLGTIVFARSEYQDLN